MTIKTQDSRAEQLAKLIEKDGKGTWLDYDVAKLLRQQSLEISELKAMQEMQTKTAIAQATFSSDDLECAHQLGFLRAAQWSHREDLVADTDSPAYKLDRDVDLSSIHLYPVACKSRQAAEAAEATPSSANHHTEMQLQQQPERCNPFLTLTDAEIEAALKQAGLMSAPLLDRIDFVAELIAREFSCDDLELKTS